MTHDAWDLILSIAVAISGGLVAITGWSVRLAVGQLVARLELVEKRNGELEAMVLTISQNCSKSSNGGLRSPGRLRDPRP